MGTEAALARFGVSLTESQATGPVRWDECGDLEVRDEWGKLVYAGPRYFRCSRGTCLHLVTHGMVAQGGCWCGNRRLAVAHRLTTEERALLKRGYYPLVAWEVEQIQPVLASDKQPGWGKVEYDKRFA